MTTKILLSVLVIIVCSFSAFSQAPAITGFSPVNGPINTPVIISGTGFSTSAGNNIVYFGAVRASVTSSTATQLNVVAPAGTSYQPISVTVNGRTAFASKPFVITFPGVKPLSQESFKPYVDLNYPLQTFDMSDIDRDGKVDIVYSNWNDGSVALVQNNSVTGSITTASFADPVTVTDGTEVNKMLTADFDGDGAKDILKSANPTAAFQVYRNTGASVISSSSFGTALTLPLQNPATDFSYGDFDGDGLIDIVAITTDFSNFFITIFQNTSTPGTISFAPRLDIANADGIMNITVGDIDGDGRPDMLVSNYNRMMSIYRNKLTGPGIIAAPVFENPFDLFSNDYFQSAVVADMDQDGKNDIVLSSQGIVIYHNIGTPGTLSASSFDPAVQLASGGDIGIGDLNGDGRPDLALASNDYSSISVITNNTTTGTLTSSSFSDPVVIIDGYNYRGLYATEARIYDIDNDGKSDVLILNSKVPNLTILRNVSGANPPVPAIASLTPKSATPGSTVTLTGTNFGSAPSDNAVFFGATRAVVTAATPTSLSVTVPLGATVDYVTVTANTRTAFSPIQFSPLSSGASGDNVAFLDPVDIPAAGNAGFITLKDLDNDGRADIVVQTIADFFTSVSMYKNSAQDGTLVFDDAYISANIGYNYGVTDADGDGIVDLVGASEDGGDGSLFLVSSGTDKITDFGTDPLIIEEGIPDPGNFAVADLDGDGQPDVGIVETNNNGVLEFLRNTNGSFPYDYLQFVNPDPAPNFLAFADIDNDGKPDAVYSQPAGNTISVLQNTSAPGTISFSDPITFSTDTAPGMITTGDLDGDGRMDIITVNESSVSILRNTAQSPGVISASSLAPHFEIAVNSPTWAATADLNGDGKLDLGVTNGDNTVAIFRNVSSSGSLSADSFAGNIPVSTGLNPTSLAFGDLNNDGITDMAVTLGVGNAISVYANAGGDNSDAKLVVYNGVSPNGDGKNDHWHIQNINILPDTKANHVTVYNRWGDMVYQADNYDNSSTVFTGKTSSGHELPSGTYFYKITFSSDRKSQTGYLSLKR